MSRTGVVWGLDRFGQAVASALPQRGRAWRLLAIEPGPAPPELSALVPIVEDVLNAREPGAVVLVLLATAGESDATTIRDAASKARAALDACPAGHYETWLVLFLPGLSTEAEQKVRAFELFSGLEHDGAGLGGLAALMVLPRRLRQGGRPSPSEPPEVEVLDLLDVAISDAVLAAAVAGAGALSQRDDYRFADRGCRYSTAGLRRLEYPADACFEHLCARFADELFHLGLNDTGSDGDPEHVAHLVEAAVAQAVEQASHRIRMPPPVSVGVADDTLPSGADRVWFDAFRRQVKLTAAGAQVHAAAALQAIAGWPAPAFLDLLRTGPRFIADAELFLELLLEEQATDVPVGWSRFETRFLHEPLVQMTERILDASTRRVAAELGVLQVLPERDGPLLEWLLAVSSTLAGFVNEQPSVQRAWMRFSLDVLDAVLPRFAGEYDHASAIALLESLSEAYARFENDLAPDVMALQEERARLGSEINKIEEASRSLRSVFFGRRQRREALEQLQQELADIDAPLATITGRVREARQFLIEATNDIALPVFVRTLFTDLARSECRDLAARFRGFVHEVDAALQARRASAIVPDRGRRDTTNVATAERLDIVYRRTVGHGPMSVQADRLLKFVPRPGLSYVNCRNLADHFVAGTTSLLDRMGDFASSLFVPVLSLTVIDVLELEGEVAAKRELTTELARPGAAAAFSPTLVPAHTPPGTSPSHVVWADESTRSKLEDRYAALLSPDVRFVESGDRRLIQVGSLYLGFPAFALQALEDCRELAGATSPEDPRDIWPR